MRASAFAKAFCVVLLAVLLVGCHLAGTSVAGGRAGQAPADAARGPLALSVMTYNVMFDFPSAGFDPWSVRGLHEAEIINAHRCDLVGLQEPFPWQVNHLHGFCPGFADRHLRWYPDATAFYRADRFERVGGGHFWLSPSPGRMSRGFGNILPRLVVWLTLRDRFSGRAFFWADTHFDNTSPFQETAAPLFLAKVRELSGGLPVVVTGDFNSPPASKAYRILTGGAEPGGFRLTDAYDLAGAREVWNAPGDARPYDAAERIDHVFVAGGAWACGRWIADMTRYGTPPRDGSDHFAIVAELMLRGE